jgi:hypothetical protein
MATDFFPQLAPKEVPALYLDLMKRCLLNGIYPESESGLRASGTWDFRQQLEGESWPKYAHTMVGLKRLENVQHCVESVLRAAIPGDLLEAGVWRGGVTIFMRALLKAYGIADRCVWVADSFQGLPPPNRDKYPADWGSRLHEYAELAVSLEQVQGNFARYGLLDGQVRFLNGWFRDTLPGAAIRRLAVLRLDGDLYESTMDTLVPLYPKLSVGGFVIIDDYGSIAANRQAVLDYRDAHGIRDELVRIDRRGVYWRRTA